MTRMRAMMEAGVTILFVSHDTHSIKTLCNKAIWIHNGIMLEYGAAGSVANKYIEMQHLQMNDELDIGIQIDTSEISHDAFDDANIPIIVGIKLKEINPQVSQRYGDGRATILDAIILDSNFKPTQELLSNHEYFVQIAVKFNIALPTFVIGFSLSSLDGVQQLTWTNAQDGILFPSVKQNETTVVTTKIKVPITAGTYTLSIGVELPINLNQQHQFLDVIMNFIPLKVNFASPEKGFSAMFYTQGEYSLKTLSKQ